MLGKTKYGMTLI